MTKILIVDDHLSNRQFLATLLGYSSHQMLEAQDGVQALEITRLEQPDLIITDILMPVMDGYELARRLREDPALESIPIIFYTASYGLREARSLARAAGVQYVLTKPAEPQAILDMVATALGEIPALSTHFEITTKPLLDPVQIVSSKLSAKMKELGGLHSRLSDLIALGIEISAERNPQHLLERFCESARRILGAKYAAVGILARDGKSLQHFITSGMEPEIVAQLESPPTGKGLLGVLLKETGAVRLRDLTTDPHSVGFPPGHPLMRSFLGVPIGTSLQAYGNLYLTEKIGAEEFSEEDERLALTLASQIAVAYENAYLYHDIQRHAVRLQLEIVERQKVQETLAQTNNLLSRAEEIGLSGSWSWDLKRDQVTWSDGLYRIFGLRSRETEADFESYLERIHPEDREFVRLVIETAVREGGSFQFENRIARADGSIRIHDSRGEVILDETGKPMLLLGTVADITERKRAETRLRESEERFRALVDHSTDAIAVNAPDGTVFYVSPAVEKITGIRAAVGEKVNPFEHIHSEDAELSQRMLEQIIQTPLTSATVEFRIRHPDGSWRWVEVVSTNLIAEPSVRGIVTNFTDITDRKRMEEGLKSSEERFSKAFHSSPAGINITRASDSRFVDANQAFLELIAYSREEIVGRTPFELDLFPNMSSITAVRALLREQGRLQNFETEVRTNSGETRQVLFSTEVFQLEGEPHYLTTMIDITERKRVEEQLKRQLKNLNALRTVDIAISSSFDLGITLDVVLQEVLAQLDVDAGAVLLFHAGRQTIEYATSRGFLSAFPPKTELKLGEGYASRVVLGRKIIHILDFGEQGSKLAEGLPSDPQEFMDYYGTPLIARGEVKGVLEIYHRSRLRTDPERLAFLEALAGQAAIAIDNAQLFENLQRSNVELEHHVAERTVKLKQANIELEYANRAKDEFLATMSHELRTPLTSILGLSESLLEQRRGSLNEHQQRSIEVIAASGQHLLELINDILDLSKIEAGKLDLNSQPVSVEELCRSSLAFIKSQAAKKRLTVTYVNETSISRIEADPKRLKQILVNLLTNAVKFTPEQGNVTLRVEADLEQDLIQFSVSDTGIGIAPEDLRRVFEPFVQVDSRLNRQQEGTGLGLALVQRLADLHGGGVLVESEAGKGSHFTVNLPYRQEAPVRPEEGPSSQNIPSAAEQIHETNIAAASGARSVILLADDNLANILTIGDYLESHGYQVVVVRDGVEAIKRAQEINPDIILMDIQMPVMDGFDAMSFLRGNPRFSSTPIIALTALAMPGDRERCLAAGATEYLSKPVSLKRLRQMIENFLHRHSSG